MMTERHGNASSTDPRRWERGRLPLAAFVFVLVALVALAVTPALVLERISRATDEVTTTLLPAYDGLRDFAFATERRTSSSRSRFLTGDPRYDLRLGEARAAEAQALQTLETLAPRLGPVATAQVESLRRLAGRRDSLETALILVGEPLEAYRALLPQFDALGDSILVQLGGLRQEVARVAESRVADEARWTNLQRWLSVVLGLLAVLAALLVGWFTWQQLRMRREVQGALEEANRQRTLAERRREELERATEARVRLLRGVTHDVKNPLGAAKGYAELLALGVRSPLAPEQAPFVEGIQRSVDSALAIIADLLDLARADSGGLVVNREEVDPHAVARAAADDHRSAAEAAGHTLEVVQPPEPLTVYTDLVRVQQVLGNLLSNAIKYTPPPGRITVQTGSLAQATPPRDGAWTTIRVSDTGPGIPPEHREAVFDEFTRLHDGSTQQGHGLGLAIARRIARLLGGDLSVEEAEGGGAAFVLWLPVRQRPDAPATEHEPIGSGAAVSASPEVHARPSPDR